MPSLSSSTNSLDSDMGGVTEGGEIIGLKIAFLIETSADAEGCSCKVMQLRSGDLLYCAEVLNRLEFICTLSSRF